MLRIIYVPESLDLGFFGEKRFEELPHGLRTMLILAFSWTKRALARRNFVLKAMIFGDESVLAIRVKRGIIECNDSHRCLHDFRDCHDMTLAWMSFFALHDWWQGEHWEIQNELIECVECHIRETRKACKPDRCTNMRCPSQPKWNEVNGVESSV